MRISKLEDAIEEPVTAEQVKADLILAGNDDDELIEEWIASFRQLIEEYTKQSLLTQEWRMSFKSTDLDEDGRISLLRPPIQSIVLLKFVDLDGNEEVLTEDDDYFLDDEELAFVGSADDGGRYVVDYLAGYESIETVPLPILNAIRNATAAHYENREIFVLPPAVKMQLAPFRRGRLP